MLCIRHILLVTNRSVNFALKIYRCFWGTVNIDVVSDYDRCLQTYVRHIWHVDLPTPSSANFKLLSNRSIWHVEPDDRCVDIPKAMETKAFSFDANLKDRLYHHSSHCHHRYYRLELVICLLSKKKKSASQLVYICMYVRTCCVTRMLSSHWSMKSIRNIVFRLLYTNCFWLFNIGRPWNYLH